MDYNNSCLALPPTPFIQLDIQTPMACHSSKRPREHEELTAHNEDISRETKKHRPLPLRSSPRSNRRLKIAETAAEPISLSALTPVDSSEDEDVFSKQFFTEPDRANAQQPQEPCAIEMDLDASMEIDTCEDTGEMGEGDTSSLSIARLDDDTPQLLPTPYNITRQPLNAGHIATFPPASVQTMNSPEMVAGARDTLCPPPDLSGDTVTWRSPRLPSPVSDNGDARGKDTSGDMEMVDDMPSQQSPSLLNSAAVEAEAAVMRKRLSSLDLPDQGNAEPHSSVKSAKKLAFSMGYRADCDKCRRRVPGHYSHIIRG